MENGTHRTTEFFEAHQGEIDPDGTGAIRLLDPYLFPSLVRWYARLSLRSEGHEAESFDLTVDEVANIGLYLKFDDFHIRILKSDRSVGLPLASSDSRLEFYEQPALFGEPMPFMNLVVLWDAPDGMLRQLKLVCPHRSDGSKGDTRWALLIPYPAELGTPAPAPPTEEEDLSEIMLPPEEETGSTDGR
jgi:hypothetical protein